MSAGSSSGTLARAAATICAVRSSGLMVMRDPLNARPIGERAVATMTASVIWALPCVVDVYCLVAYASALTGHRDRQAGYTHPFFPGRAMITVPGGGELRRGIASEAQSLAGPGRNVADE